MPDRTAQIHGQVGYYEYFCGHLFKTVKTMNGGYRLIRVSKMDPDMSIIDKLVHVMRVACCDKDTCYRARGE